MSGLTCYHLGADDALPCFACYAELLLEAIEDGEDGAELLGRALTHIAVVLGALLNEAGASAPTLVASEFGQQLVQAALLHGGQATATSH